MWTKSKRRLKMKRPVVKTTKPHKALLLSTNLHPSPAPPPSARPLPSSRDKALEMEDMTDEMKKVKTNKKTHTKNKPTRPAPADPCPTICQSIGRPALEATQQHCPTQPPTEEDCNLYPKLFQTSPKPRFGHIMHLHFFFFLNYYFLATFLDFSCDANVRLMWQCFNGATLRFWQRHIPRATYSVSVYPYCIKIALPGKQNKIAIQFLQFLFIQTL